MILSPHRFLIPRRAISRMYSSPYRARVVRPPIRPYRDRGRPPRLRTAFRQAREFRSRCRPANSRPPGRSRNSRCREARSRSGPWAGAVVRRRSRLPAGTRCRWSSAPGRRCPRRIRVRRPRPRPACPRRSRRDGLPARTPWQRGTRSLLTLCVDDGDQECTRVTIPVRYASVNRSFRCLISGRGVTVRTDLPAPMHALHSGGIPWRKRRDREFERARHFPAGPCRPFAVLSGRCATRRSRFPVGE